MRGVCIITFSINAYGHGIINSKVPLMKTDPNPVANDMASGGKASHVVCSCLA